MPHMNAANQNVIAARWGITRLQFSGHCVHRQFNIKQFYVLPHTLFICFVRISEQTATCATYCINWLVFMAEMKSVHSAVRTDSLYKADNI